ncbi:MAG: hypothetical protein AB7R89_25455 [Dehalococcoidia bacterium]
MRNRFAQFGVTAAVAALLLLSVACEEQSTAEQQAALCTELTELSTDLQNLEDIGPTSTVGELKDAEKAVREQAEEVRRAYRSLQESKADDLKQAVDNLEESVTDISNSTTIAEAKANIAQNVVAVRTATTALSTQFDCG